MSAFPRMRLLALVSVMILFAPANGWVQEKEKKAPQRPPSPVVVAKVFAHKVARQVTLVGSVEALKTSIVAAEGGGLVAAFPVREGQQVQKGDLLVRLKSRELELELKGRVAERERIQANLENAHQELSRVTRLRENNSVPQRSYDDALYSHRALAQALLAAEAHIETLAYQIAQRKVTAPFDGFVADEHTQVGQWIQPGGPVVTLMDMATIQVAVDVPERHAVKLLPGARVRVTFTSLSGEQRLGQIDTILPQGNAMTRTFPVRVMLDNPDFVIRAGMEAVATFDLSERIDALMVPKDAVVTAGDRSLVYRVTDGQAFPVVVTVIGYHDGSAAVSGPLKVGEKVVIRGNERLRPGQDVAVTEDRSPQVEE